MAEFRFVVSQNSPCDQGHGSHQRYEKKQKSVHHIHFVFLAQIPSPVGAGRHGPGDVLDRQQADEADQEPHEGVQKREVRNLRQRRRHGYFESHRTEQEGQGDRGAGRRIELVAVVRHSEYQERQQAEHDLQCGVVT